MVKDQEGKLSSGVLGWGARKQSLPCWDHSPSAVGRPHATHLAALWLCETAILHLIAPPKQDSKAIPTAAPLKAPYPGWAVRPI